MNLLRKVGSDRTQSTSSTFFCDLFADIGMQVADQLPNTDGRELEINRGEPQKRSVVAWISGQEAVMMEKASEEAFVQEVHTLMDRFPALRLPRSFKVPSQAHGSCFLCFPVAYLTSLLHDSQF